MKNIEKNHYDITYNPSLNRHDDVVYFKEKLERAKILIARVGLPEKWLKDLEAKQKKSLMK